MPTIPQLTCTVEPHPQDAAIAYTLRLLASLIGQHAVIRQVAGDCDVGDGPDLYYGTSAATATSARLWIRPDAQFWSCIPPTQGVIPRGQREWHGSVFPVWGSPKTPADEVGGPSSNLSPVDPVAAAFFLVSRAEEYVARRRDRHDRFRAEDSWMCRHGLCDRPLVHEYARAIAVTLGRTGTSDGLSSVWPDGGRFAVAFTHDIDRLRMHGSWWLDVLRGMTALRAGGGVRNLRRRLASRWAVRARGHRDPYDTLDDICRRHAGHGFRATFFWIAASPSRRDADYAPKNPVITAHLRQLLDGGHECGLHGSYDSLNDQRRLELERTELASVSGAPIGAVRQHYLRFTVADTWQAQADAGFTIGSTLGFAEQFGFRCGLAVPFRPWSFAANAALDIWEVPLVMMDVSAKEYMRLRPDAAADQSRTLITRLAEVGGGAAVLWHNSSLNAVDWDGWEPVYEAWLDETKAHGGRGLTLADLVESWELYLTRLDGV